MEEEGELLICISWLERAGLKSGDAVFVSTRRNGFQRNCCIGSNDTAKSHSSLCAILNLLLSRRPKLGAIMASLAMAIGHRHGISDIENFRDDRQIE